MRSLTRAGRLEFAETARPPVYLTELIGRGREVEEVSTLIRAGRLVSLIGAGGSGKTRLAAAIASRHQSRLRGAVGWIDLSALSDPELVPHHAATTLGLREQPGHSVVESLIAVIGKSPALLALDNCEHLVGACAVLVDALLRACPSLRVLATSRQALGIVGEKTWLVPPLTLPEPDVPRETSGAVQLFVERARDVQPDFLLTESNADAVARICRRLDGLPLAIELAAARAKLLSPEQLADRLDDAFTLLSNQSRVSLPRHRTLRALIDWSYDLLDENERLLFERLSVFAGGFTLGSVETVAGWGTLSPATVLEPLASLVDRSLVVMREWGGEARYHLLETVRQYASERLHGSTPGHHSTADVHQLRRRHATHFLEFASLSAERLHGPGELDWLTRLGAEHVNIRTALAWSLAVGETDMSLRFCLALRDFWRVRGHLTEGRHAIDAALRLPGGSPGLRARALAGAAVLGRMQGDYRFLESLKETETLARDACDQLALADTLTQLGICLRDKQEVTAAGQRLDEAITLWRQLNDAWGLSLALGARASIALAQSNLPLARALRTEAVELSRRAGDQEGEARGLIGLGEVARLENELDSARDYNERCLTLFDRIGDSWHAGSVYQNLGWIAAETGRLDDAFFAFSESVARFQQAGNPFGLALCLFGFARLLHEHGDSDSAAIALATATTHAAQVAKGVAAPADAACCERTLAVVEAALDPERIARARREGAALSLAEGIARATRKLRSTRPADEVVASAPAPVTAPSTLGTDRFEWQSATDPFVTPDLRVRALGPLQILLRDRPLAGDAFGSSKPRELLLLLLCNPDGCTREQVGVAFWPEASTPQVKNSFHVTLHRLRKALEHPDWIVAAGDRYRLDPSLRIDFDALRFEVAIREALRENAAAPTGDNDAGDRLTAALALYQGDFLEGEVVGDWHLDTQNRLSRLFMEGLLARGTQLMDAGRPMEAAAVFQRLVDRERLHDEAYRRLMICHARAGDRIQAIRVFQNLTAILRSELNAEPDPSTVDLYERIQRAVPL